ncbi:MFS transporter [Streptomyces sp. NPDC097595]|uniref:MFS transporter n=1 Tax=Streptomyces sp. NPDC097595 TaxID=3366090 RepID=UPI003829D2C6
MSNEEAPGPLSVRRVLGWSAGSLAANAFNTLPALLLLIYLTDALGVSAALAGVVVAVPKLFDVVISPWLGAISDREAIRTGRRRRLMVAGASVLPFAFVLTFSAPAHGSAAALWVFFAFILTSAAYLCFQVPFMALPAEMTPLPDERTRLMTWRTLFFTVGMLIGGVVGPLLTKGDNPGTYQRMSLVIGAFLLALLAVPVLSTRWVRSRPSGGALSLPQALRAVRGNRPFALAVAVFFVKLILTGMTIAGLPYMATYYLGGRSHQAVVFVAFTVVGAVSVPGAGALVRNWGKPRVLSASMALWAVAGCAMYPAVKTGVAPTAVLGAVLGVAFAGLQVSLFAMLPESIRLSAERSGKDQAGAFSGVWTAVDTAGHALAPLCFTVVLTVTGYASSTLAHPVTQTPLAREGILLGFSVIPSLLLLAAIPLVRAYGRAVRAAS